MRRIDPRLLLSLLVGLASGAPATEVPPGVSPGAPSQLTQVSDACPVFSWGEVGGALGYELVVYRLHEGVDEVTPVLRQALEGAVDGWTPPLGRCLEPGGRYAWSVRAVGGEQVSGWSSPRLFEVPDRAPDPELREAIEVVRRYLEARRDGSIVQPDAIQVEALAALVSESEEPDSLPVPRAVASTELSVDGGIEAASFTGDGSTLTGLQPGNIAPGTAGISVYGSSGDVSCTGCIASFNFGPGEVKSVDIGNGQVSGSDIDPSAVQARVTGSCGTGQVIQAIGSDGSVTCSTNTQVLLGQEHFVANFNGGASSVSVSRANRICFLTYVRLRDLDGGDTASCKIELSSTSWVLFAASQGDSDAQCRMRCIEVSPDRTF